MAADVPDSVYRALVAAAPDGVIVTDAGGMIVLANPQIARMTGWAQAELVGQSIEVLVPVEHRSRHVARRAAFERAPHGRPMGNDLKLWAVRKDGSRLAVEIMLSPMRIAGEPATVAFVRDATDHRRRETELEAYVDSAEAVLIRNEKLRALGQMAAGIAHDFKNLLNPLGLHLEVVDRALRKAGVARPDAIAVMRDIIQRGVQTIDRLRTFSRLEPEVIADYVEPSALARDAVELVRPRLADHPGIALVTAIEPTGTVRGNVGDVVGALVNLIVNAIEACGERGTIVVRTGSTDKAVWIEVADDGPGMTAEVQARVFEPFFSTKGAQGTGLGLANVFATVQRHGGEVTVDSAPGQGARFRMHLPR